jgi:hypothetical protein
MLINADPALAISENLRYQQGKRSDSSIEMPIFIIIPPELIIYFCPFNQSFSSNDEE